MRKTWITCALVAIAAAPATAHAAIAGQSLNGIEYDGAGSENNVLSVDPTNTGKIAFTESAGGVGVTPQLGCAAGAGAQALCAADDWTVVAVKLGSGDDSVHVQLALVSSWIDGGAGTDLIFGGGGADVLGGGLGGDTIHGGAGDDLIDDTVHWQFGAVTAGSGNDTMLGEAGDDTLVAGPGADLMDGGADRVVGDTADYSARTDPQRVTVDAGGADDGSAGEGDDVKDVERVLGGSAGDTLVASSDPTTLVGGAGDDHLTGGAGADTLIGGDAAGSAGSGNDTLDGGAGADELRGGDGTDTVTYASRTHGVTVSPDDVADDGESGEHDNVRSDVEAFVGGSGDDAFKLLDGRAESVTCGAGNDTVVADAFDTVAADCENVAQGGAGAGAGSGTGTGGGTTPTAATPGGGGQPPAAALRLPSGTVRPTARRMIAVTLSCGAGAGGCAGRVSARLGKARLTRAAFAILPGRTLVVRWRLTAAQARRGGRLTLSAKPVIGGVEDATAVLAVRGRKA